jgi:hypothetical protein
MPGQIGVSCLVLEYEVLPGSLEDYCARLNKGADKIQGTGTMFRHDRTAIHTHVRLDSALDVIGHAESFLVFQDPCLNTNPPTYPRPPRLLILPVSPHRAAQAREKFSCLKYRILRIDHLDLGRCAKCCRAFFIAVGSLSMLMD